MKVVVLDDYQGAALDMADWEPVTRQAEVMVLGHHIANQDELAERLADADVIVLMRERTAIGAALMDRLPKLQLIVTTGVANAAIDIRAANDRGVTVCATRVAAEAVAEMAEFTWGLVLALSRNLVSEARAVAAGAWQQGIGETLCGKTLGIVGLGKIGAAVAKIGMAFGMPVCAWSENLAAERAAELGVQAVSKPELFAQSDVVSIHLRLSGLTRGIVGSSDIARMKRSALIVNTARGPLIDEMALAEALHARRIAGAALDAFEIEPLPLAHPFRVLSNVLAMPHIGYVTRSTYRIFYEDAVADIAAFLAGQPIRVLPA